MTKDTKAYISYLKKKFDNKEMNKTQALDAIKGYANTIFFSECSSEWAEIRCDEVSKWEAKA